MRLNSQVSSHLHGYDVFSYGYSNYPVQINSAFWQEWQKYRNDLYRFCLKCMNGNVTEAEEALSRAMLKAWEKVQNYTDQIVNIKAWLTRLTHNICVDIHRENSRRGKSLENIELYASDEEQETFFFDSTKETDLEINEKKTVICQAIHNLPSRLRETFILNFYQELSYQEIAQQQNISYQNVCKRISQARAMLREELRDYFIGSDETPTNLLEQNTEVEPIENETLTLSPEVKEVEIAFNELSHQVELSKQQRDSSFVKVNFEQILKVKKDFCYWEEMTLSERHLAKTTPHPVIFSRCLSPPNFAIFNNVRIRVSKKFWRNLSKKIQELGTEIVFKVGTKNQSRRFLSLISGTSN
jgi:RNA polymerase sigma factor (sigma-70 family)